MKKLTFKQMKIIEGGRTGFWSGFSCGIFAIAAIGLAAPTAGASLLIGTYAGAIACGTALGLELN